MTKKKLRTQRALRAPLGGSRAAGIAHTQLSEAFNFNYGNKRNSLFMKSPGMKSGAYSGFFLIPHPLSPNFPNPSAVVAPGASHL